MILFAHARPGYRYKLTYAGRQIKAIATKYLDEANAYRRYLYHVPRTWVTNGYVEEVKENNNGN